MVWFKWSKHSCVGNILLVIVASLTIKSTNSFDSMSIGSRFSTSALVWISPGSALARRELCYARSKFRLGTVSISRTYSFGFSFYRSRIPLDNYQKSGSLGSLPSRSRIGPFRSAWMLHSSTDCNEEDVFNRAIGQQRSVHNKETIIREPKAQRYKTRSSNVIPSQGRKANNKKKDKKYYKSDKEKKLFRVDRILSNRGWGSRSQMQDLVRRKAVMMRDPDNDDGWTRVKTPSVRLPKDSVLMVEGKECRPIPLLLAYHKPKGVLSAMRDNMGRRHLGEVLDPTLIKASVHPVGRLDFDTSGLILFSSSGDLTQRLLHPRHSVEKEYVATVQNPVREEELRRRLSVGVETAEGVHVAALLDVLPISTEDEEPRPQTTMENNESEDDGKSSPGPLTEVRVMVTEGKHRMVRRMLANAGHPVVELRRERHGGILLGDLPCGEFRELKEPENAWLEKLTSSD